MRKLMGAVLVAGLFGGTGLASAQSGPPPSGPGGVRSSTTTSSKWVRMISRKGGLTALVPPSGPVKRNLFSQDTPMGPLNVTTLDIGEGKFHYFIVYFDASGAVDAEKNAKTILEETVQGIVEQSRGKLADNRDMTLDGHPGVAFRLTSADGSSVLTFRAFVVGQRIYQFFVQTGSDTTNAPEIAKFLDSCALWSPKPGHFDRPSSPDEDIFYTTGDPGSGPPPPGRRR